MRMEKMGFPKSRGWLLTLLLAMAIWVAGPAIVDAQFRSKPQGQTQPPSGSAGQANPPAPKVPAPATAPGPGTVQGQAAARPPAPSPGPATAPAQPPARQLGKPAPPASGGRLHDDRVAEVLGRLEGAFLRVHRAVAAGQDRDAGLLHGKHSAARSQG